MTLTDTILDIDKYIRDSKGKNNTKSESSHAFKDHHLKLRIEIDRLIQAIDTTLSKQVSAIIHHERFRKLEASWRQLHQLTFTIKHNNPVLIRILSVTWKELARDAERAFEFDQTRLFNFIYSQEFDMPGGQPFGLLIGDYNVSMDINQTYGTDDVNTLEYIASIAAASFAPFVCNADPTLVNVSKFAELDRELDMSYLGTVETKARWTQLRQNPDSRFIGVTCPNILVRPPYKFNDIKRRDGFCFREEVYPTSDHLLWGGAAFAFAHIVIREFIESGWFADIRGIREEAATAGSVDMFQTIVFDTDKNGFASQAPVEIRLTYVQEAMLSQLGLIPLIPLPYTADMVFNSNQSLHKPPRYSSEIANENARIAAMLQYVLCASRFAHFLKLIMRENIGQIATARSLKEMLNNWLADYCIGNDDADEDKKAQYPLREGKVNVFEIPGKPGIFSCIMRLQPHFQLDDVSASFQILADMNSQARQK